MAIDEVRKELECPKCHKQESAYWIEEYGQCFMCKHREDEKRIIAKESEQAVKEGEACSERAVICPYCGHAIIDTCDYHEAMEIECDECGKEYELDIEWSPTFSTRKSDV